MKRLAMAAAIAVVMAVVLVSRAPAPAPHAGAEAQAIASAIMSPFCPGLILTACPSENARALRMEIRERLEAGESRAAIEADLVTRFGPGVLADPSSVPGGRIALLVPAALGFAGLAFMVMFVRRSTRRAAAATAPGEPTPDQATLDRLEDELARLE